MLKLNSIPSSCFAASGVDNIDVKVNSNTISRNEIVLTGRLLATEFIGNIINSNEISKEKFNSRLKDKHDYAELAKKHTEKKIMFCAAMANAASGKEAPASFDEVKNNASYATDAIFLRTLAAIDIDVINPIYPSVMDSVAMGLMEWTPVSLGSTTQIDIMSNDVFLFEDSAAGSARSTTKNYLYKKSITATPKFFACNATIKWYEDVVNGDAGRYYASIMKGMYNKIYAKMIATLNGAISGGTYVLPALTAATYTTANWTALTDKVAAANGVSVGNLMAIGTRSALSNIVPVDGTGGAILGMQYGLGREWFTNGYLANAGGIDLFPVTPAVVPGTQNTTVSTIDTGNNIYIVPKAGYGYAPMRGVYAEGSPMTLTATPRETADLTIDINVTAMFDIIPLFASKVGVMTSVYPTA